MRLDGNLVMPTTWVTDSKPLKRNGANTATFIIWTKIGSLSVNAGEKELKSALPTTPTNSHATDTNSTMANSTRRALAMRLANVAMSTKIVLTAMVKTTPSR